MSRAKFSQIGSSAHTIISFAETYKQAIGEQHGLQQLSPLPTEREVVDMLALAEVIERAVGHVSDAVQTAIQCERAGEGTEVQRMYNKNCEVDLHRQGIELPIQHEMKRRRWVSSARPQLQRSEAVSTC